MRARSFEELIAIRVQKNAQSPAPGSLADGHPSKCWIWTGYICNKGYGWLNRGGFHGGAHRYFYMKLIGPIPEDHEVDHRCERRACVNPEHLEVVSHLDNVQRGYRNHASLKKKRCPRGHAYAGKHLYIAKDGSRKCMTCIKDRVRRVRKERKNATQL